MALPPGATRVSIPPSTVTFPNRIIELPAGVAKPRESCGFGFRPNRGVIGNHLGGDYWENRVPFVESQRLAAAAASRGIATSFGEDFESRYRRPEPITPQNSILSDGYLSGRCLGVPRDKTFESVSDTKSIKSVQKFNTPIDLKPTKAKSQYYENETTRASFLESGSRKRNNTPQETSEIFERYEQRVKTPENPRLRQMRWSTTAIGETPGEANLVDGPHNGQGGRQTGHQSKNPCLRSDFTFSTYDFYNKHNQGSWFSSSVPVRSKRSRSMEEERKIEELRNYKKIFSSGGIEDLVKDWAQEAYKARLFQMLVARDEAEENEPVAPLLVHLKKQSTADSLPAIYRKDSVPPKETRKSSVFYNLPTFDHLTEQERWRKRKIRNFRWYSHLIRAMVRLSANMKQLSNELTHKSAYSEFLYIMAGAKTHAGQEGLNSEGGGGKSGEPQLLFDKSWFSRGRARSRMPPWAIEVMSRPPDRRTPNQILHLKNLLTTMKSFRENMTEDMRTKMCQVVRYTKCDKGRVVLRQGHLGHDFYFIFSGSVFIQIDIYDPDQEEMRTSVENVLRMGEGFGEIALLGDGHRTASVICKEPTELCQIDRATFLEVCPALFNQLLTDKVNFARQFPLFSPWDPEDLKKLCFLSQVLDVPHSTVIEANWARPDFVYFVMKGRVSMLKEFDVTDIEKKARTTRGVQDDTDSEMEMEPMLTEDDGKRQTMFANVGTLSAGSHTELAVLAVEPPKDIMPIALVSEGARLLRITVRIFRRIAPRKLCEEYLRKTYTRMTFPSEEHLRNLYLVGKSWSEFKSTILKTQLLGQSGAPLATIPATLKGSSGWSKWPGYAVRRKKRNKLPKVASLFNHEDYARHLKPFHGGELTLEGIFEENEDIQDQETETTDRTATDEIGYFYDSESSEDPFLRTPRISPLDDPLDSSRIESARSNNQNPPKVGPVSSWRKRLPPN